MSSGRDDDPEETRRPARHLAPGANPRPGMDPEVAAVVIVGALGAALLFFGLGHNFLVEYHAYQDRGVVVTGRVVDYDEPGYRRQEAVKVDFEVSGERYVDWTDRFQATLRVGDDVELLVDPEQPGRFQALDWGYGRAETVLLWAAGAVALLVAIGAAVLQWVRR